jgi:hypothetical protein
MNVHHKPLFYFLVLGYAVASVALFLFSYTQVDLSLTLSRVSIFQVIQKTFQYVGFYERPTATLWYVVLVLCFFLLYGLVWYAVRMRKITSRSMWILIALVTVLVVFSYPAFSYDIFNYMFYAKEVLVYQKNPFFVTPLQFTGVEPWLSFMHWTHVSSPYTPLWILMSIPAYLLGFGYFLLILWNFKLLAAFWYIVTAVYISKILGIREKENKDVGVALFAFNPLVIFEILVSGHNDIAMMAFAMMSVYYFMGKQRTLSYVLLALSVATKLMTIFLYPVIVFGYKKWYAFAAMSIGLVLVITQREIQPWYFVWILPFVALIPENRILPWLSGGISMGLLLRYAPYFYYGYWNNPVPAIELWVTSIPIIAVISLILVRELRRRILR